MGKLLSLGGIPMYLAKIWLALLGLFLALSLTACASPAGPAQGTELGGLRRVSVLAPGVLPPAA